jgi:predicted DCC family thiol-disulfide oxidoreductase YuxK
VKEKIRVAIPPVKPLIIFDGDCGLCTRWIEHWRRTTEDHVDYVPFQEPKLARRFPELSRKQLEVAVRLVETNGSVYFGAEAALRARAYHSRKQSLLRWYQRFSGFARFSEWAYAFVVRHRRFFSVLTCWGRCAPSGR